MSQHHPWPFRLLGKPRNPLLVFLHGYLGAGEDWQPIVEECAAYFLCVVPDLPGHGQNIDQPLSLPLSFELLGTGLAHLLDQFPPGPVGLVGYSMGGRIALYGALKQPHRISALVLESCSPGIAVEAARRKRASVDDRRAESILANGLDDFVDRWYEMELFATLQRQPRLFQKTKQKRKMNDTRWAAKIISELSPGRQPSLWTELGSLSMPALLLAGALDSKYADIMPDMGRRIPESKVEIVPNAGHNIHLEAPNRFVELVTGFLQQSPLIPSKARDS